MYCSNCGKNIGEHAVFCQFCGSQLASVSPFAQFPPRRFVRSIADKKIAGVCAGVARYFDLDATLLRAIWLLAVLLGGTGLVAYIVLWIVMPRETQSPMLPA